MLFTHATREETLFKTSDGRFITNTGTDVSDRPLITGTPRQYIELTKTNQPAFYVITEEEEEEEDKYVITSICGPYSQEEARQKEDRDSYILLATKEKIDQLAADNGLW
jgi:hypothetical protein